ncbi:peptidase S51 family protein [Nitzschia inconspicua]|uniref:Peptidase S51 family protein n=1 Tax=Nitzschia inconspicua TaxID=303405 RepID=A0A9K3M623_9STRA|nr:peptidase S51 family protein [Nitzschia inconspicua]
MRSFTVFLLMACSVLVESFSPNNVGAQNREYRTSIRHRCHILPPTSPRHLERNGIFAATVTNDVSSEPWNANAQPLWLDKGLLLSSFTDGLRSNRDSQDWLCNALVERLWKDFQQQSERGLLDSNIFSPCNGPDPDLWQQLEDVDLQIEELYSKNEGNCHASSWRRSLEMLRLQQRQQNQDNNTIIELRLLYIPTALYALRKDSTNSPGKQRQRARADGKQRRNEIVAMLQDNLDGVAISAVTLDFDDGSVKQAECTIQQHDTLNFPTTGKEAINDWKPHLIYVQGGNTFWLHHCMEKGDWGKDLVAACCVSGDATTSSGAVYCGVSAGAIVVGNSMQTACWKEWDDPSVAPGKECYDDWKDVIGLGLAGSVSFFPHMEDQWRTMIDGRLRELPLANQSRNDGDTAPLLCCLSDEQVCFVDGQTRSMQSTGTLLSSLQQASAL